MDISIVIKFLSSITLITALQIFGVIFGALQVWYAKENKPITYFFGILSIVLGIYILFEAKLYAEIFLSMYYLTMSIYGWWYWKANRNAEPIPITYSTKKEWFIASAIVVLSFLIFFFGLITVSDSDVPLWDSLVTAFAWAGMWLLAKRKMENWIFLNISNLIAIPLLYHKDLPIYAAFTLFLFVMAIFGYAKWRSIIKEKK